MKRSFILILFLILSGCSISNHEEAKGNPKDESKEEIPQGNDLGGKNEISYPDFFPDEVITQAEYISDTLETNSGFHFVRRGATNYVDKDVGSCYSVYYWVTSFQGKDLSHGSRFMHLRLLFDTYSNKLSAICIILEFENPTQEYYDLYYNYLNPAFLKFDFNQLFEGRPFVRTEKSDDDTHSQDKFYTEYILDVS